MFYKEQIKLFYIKSAKALALLLTLALFSCSDEGCIEADDFGEYDTQTLEVMANSAVDACNYDITKPLNDASQGYGLKECFNTKWVKVYDESGKEEQAQSSSGGCNGFADLKFRNLCVDQCLSECAEGTSNTGMAEPAWIATRTKSEGRNGGVDLKPNSSISIKAVGTVKLGDKLQAPDIFISPQIYKGQTRDEKWQEQIVDITEGRQFNVAFSGKFTDNPINGGTAIGEVGSGPNKYLQDDDNYANDNIVYNAGRRIVAYILESPVGYKFDSSKSNEQEGSIDIPLLPDPNFWRCSYENKPDPLDAKCFNGNYNSLYPRVKIDLINSVFPVSADSKTNILGVNGGIIRWKNDNLRADNYDPFIQPTAIDINNDDSRIVNDILAQDMEIVPRWAAKVSFKSLDAACDGFYDIVIANSQGNAIKSYTKTGSGANEVDNRIEIKSTEWVNKHISIEAGYKLIIKKSDKIYKSSGDSCGKALAVKFSKYHDILIEKSGFVSLAVLDNQNNIPIDPASPTACDISARIINPRGSFFDVGAIKADFYEYGDFESYDDPLSQKPYSRVPILRVGNNSWPSTEIFVRKGQVIRFSPESWNMKWMSTGGERQCGVGMAMNINPRPAFLCRGYSEDTIDNAECVPKYSVTGNLIGCSEDSPKCSDPNSPSSYCPNKSCFYKMQCSNGTAENDYTRNCTIPALGMQYEDVNTCNFPSTKEYTTSTCSQCSYARAQQANIPAKLRISGMAQCYNLESYYGKVSNIPLSSGFSDEQLNDINIAKGAKILGSFNGYYGNLSALADSSLVDKETNNEIYQLKQAVGFQTTGRLKFLILDGTDFRPEAFFNKYNANSAKGSEYNGVNGFKIALSGFLEFVNGEWLEAVLCNEDTENGVKCISLTKPQSITVEEGVVILADPDPKTTDFTPKSTTSFYFDPFGTLLRGSAGDVNDECQLTATGEAYYCHTSTIPVSQIKLSFKIKDPEIGECALDSSRDSSGNSILSGIRVKNNNFVPNNCSLTGKAGVTDGVYINGKCVKNSYEGQLCTVSEDQDTKNVCKKEFRCASKYSNNSGKYYVTVRVKTPGSNVSKIVNSVISPVVKVMDGDPVDLKDPNNPNRKIGQAERIYKLIVNDSRYLAILNMSLIVALTFYGFGFLIGVTEGGLTDMVSKIVKVGLIYLFVGPQGWDWFNEFAVRFFKNGTDYLSFLMASSFDDSKALAKAIDTNNFSDKSILFGSVDKVFGMFFAPTVQKKISALLFASIFGWAYLIILYYSVVNYIYAVANAILLYLTSQVFISVLFVLGPLFFVLTLFNQTKEMFDKWLGQLIGFSLQQILLLTTLAFFNMMMYEVLKMALGYKVCWDEVWTINIVIRITLLSFWTIASLPPRTDSQSDPGDIGNPDGIPSLFSILFIWVISSLMLQFITFMTEIAATLADTIKASELASGVKASARSLSNTVGKRVGKIWHRAVGKRIQKLDKALFGSGELAKQERKALRQQNAKDIKNRSALRIAGKEAEKKFKIEHADQLIGKTKNERDELVKQARDKGMAKQGDAMGLSAAEIERLKTEKGVKYTGDNIIGYTVATGKQLYQSGGAVFNSLDDREVDSSYSKKEMHKTLKKADSDERKEILDDVKKGNLNVKKSGAEAFGQYLKNRITFKGTRNALSKAKNLVYDSEYERATEQLVDEKQINDMATMTNWSRDDKEKKKIRDRVKRNRQIRKFNQKGTTSSTIQKLEEEIQVLDEKDNDAATPHVREKGALFGRRKTTKNFLDASAKNYTDPKNAKAVAFDKAQKMHQQTQNSINALDKDIDELSVKHQAYETKYNDINNDPSFVANRENIKNLKDQIITETDPKAKEALKKQLSAANNNPNFKKQIRALKDITANSNKISNELNAKNAAKAKLVDFSESVKKSVEIMENINQYDPDYLTARENKAIAKFCDAFYGTMDKGSDIQKVEEFATEFKDLNPNP